MKKNIKWLMIVAIAFAACNKNDDDVAVVSNSSDGLPLTAGSANFSKYVALGNSLTAGYSDGTLFIEGQKTSWANILAGKFTDVGGGAFRIPFMADNIGGFKIGGTVFQGPRTFFNQAAGGPQPVSGIPSTEITNILTGPFNNMGVPGAKSFHLLAANYGNVAGLPNAANPFFVRFASSPSASIIGDAMAQAPTFFSLWIGNNDVLSYATSGGGPTPLPSNIPAVNQIGNLNPATYGPNDITDPTVFANVYTTLVNTLTANGAKGVVGLIPDVTAVPFFTAVIPRQIPGLAPAQATQLNQLFGGINAALAAASLPARFETLIADDGNPATIESNPLLIIDETLPNISTQITAALTPSLGAAGATFLGAQYGRARHARSITGNRDYILLTTSSLIRPTPAGNNIEPGLPAALSPTFAVRGVTFPLQDSAVLTADETLQVKTATDAFNASIQTIANSKGLAIVDTRSLLNQVAATGVTSDFFTLTSAYATGGAFSLDGVHPSPRGYALIANAFMKQINAKYGSNLKAVSLGDYRVLFGQTLP